MRTTDIDVTKCQCGCGQKIQQPRTGRRRRFVENHRQRVYDRDGRKKSKKP